MSMHRVALAIVALLLGASTLPAQLTQAAHTTARQHPTIYVNIKGKTQGQFPGDVPLGPNLQPGRPGAFTAPRHDEIVALSMAYETETPRNPQTGQATGKRMHKPVVFTHDVSAATPNLFEALATNETLSTVTITVGKLDANGQMTSSYTLILTNATVTALRQFDEENILMEEVSLTFQKIELKMGKWTATDDWMPSM
jgi:type VI secretion system secreted protein Hcp